MTEYFEKIVNLETNEEILRPLNEDEVSIINAEIAFVNKLTKEKEKADAIKATAKAELLAKLGITAEEAALLLG